MNRDYDPATHIDIPGGEPITIEEYQSYFAANMKPFDAVGDRHPQHYRNTPSYDWRRAKDKNNPSPASSR
jgi:hypothetical protein